MWQTCGTHPQARQFLPPLGVETATWEVKRFGSEWVLPRPYGMLEGIGSPDEGQGDPSGIEIYRQLRAGLGPEREVVVARKDHQANALANGDDLVVGF